ncbi:MAG: ATP-binding protein [Streptosporangiaceae bacterium]|jgi:DNA helicase HerA-like ATPase
MSVTPGIGGGAAGPWYRVQAITASCLGGSAERDYASVLPAALNAVMHRHPFVAGWLSRGGGAPLELITNAGPLPGPSAPGRAPGQPGGPRDQGVPWRHEPGPRGTGSRGTGLPEGNGSQPGPGGFPRPAHSNGPLAAGGSGRGLDDPATGELAARAAGEHAAALAAPSPPAAPWRPAGGGVQELLFPWGARGVPFTASLLADLDRLVWAPCPGRQAPQLLSELAGLDAGWPGPRARGNGGLRAQGDAATPTLFEAALLTLMARPFGWLVVAEPTDLIDSETADLRTQLNVLRRYEEEHARYDADRAERRLAELDAYREAGLWNVRVLAGAATQEELSLIAPVLVGSVDLHAHPYRLRSAGGAGDLADALIATLTDPADGSQVPFAATAGALAALTGLPRREVPGVRVLDAGYFDVTSETAAGDAISLGAILDGQDRPVGEFNVPLATLNRHAFVTGATGSGKSQTVRQILEQLTSAGVGWLAIEPVKSEYAAMAGRIAGHGKVTVINPSDPGAIPLSVNPLAPEPGYPVQAHIDMVRALFLAAFDAREPFPQIMAQALQRAYEDCGWDAVTGSGQPDAAASPAVPTLARLQAAALDVVEDVGYGRELQADVRGFVDVRLRSLRTGSAGRFFEGGHPADIGELLRRNVVLAIEDVANDEDKAFLIGTLIIRIVEHLRLRARAEPAAGLRHVIVLEEAHRLLRAGREGASAHAVELFASMLAEIRAYGEGIIIAEQIPAKLVPDVVKNTALKIVHRLPAHDDRQVVGAAMNLDEEQSRQVVSLQPGAAAVFADGMDRPLRIRVPFGGDRERLPEPAELLPPPVSGRRSAACGPACTGERACTLLELRRADLLGRAADDAWLRVWTEALVLAFLTGRPLPVVPAALRQRWAGLDARLRDCLLATTLDRALQGRSPTVRDFADPQELAAAAAAKAQRMLAGGKGAGTVPGTTWVIPQLQWLHEVERVCPLGGTPDPFAPAPPLEFPLPGLADRPDAKIGQRVSGLRRHPLSMELARNRLPAWTVLLGEDDQRGFAEDLAAVMIGASHRGQLRQAAGEMGVTGWLEAVLSWPRRFIVGDEEELIAAQARSQQRAAR